MLFRSDGTLITNCGLLNITSIVQPIEQLAQKTAQMIVSLIKNEDIEKEIIMPVSLRQGDTC